MKAHWKKHSRFVAIDVKKILRSLLWRFSEITHRIFLFLLLYKVFGLYAFVIIVSTEYALCFVLFCYNHSVLVLGSIFFYHVTAGKYFGGGPGTQRIGYYIFVVFSIYRFLSSFLYLLALTVFYFAQTQTQIQYINIVIIYEWFTFILWILSMFYVTEKGTRAVYNDQLLAPLAIYQQFVQLLDFIVFGASIQDLAKHRYDHDNKNIIQYLCAHSTTNKVTIHSQERLDIIRNILFGKQHKDSYKSFLVEQNDQNQMCIHYAVTANQLNIVKFFTEACSLDINVLDNNDQTGLHIAIQRSYIQIVQYLLQCPQLDISVKDAMHRTYLHFAAMTQSIQIVKCFSHVTISYHETDDYGKTMLFYVEEQPLIEYLIERHKLDINATDFDGKTVLFHSVDDNKFELTKYFIEECNVDINIRDRNGTLAFFYAQTIEMADYMIHTCQMDCNTVDDHGDSVICNAIAKHYSNALCKYYIETCHVNVAQIDKYNRSLLDIAVEHLNITQVQSLLSRNIVVDKEQSLHSDMIHIKTWCCAKDKLIQSLYELFINIGGYSIDNIVDVVNAKGNVHNIHYVIQSMRYVKEDDKLHEFGVEMLHHLLMKNNHLVNITDDDQNTPIFYCIDTEIYELVELFVENGADLYHTNAFREAPLEYAIQKCKSNEIREYLMETKYNSPHTAPYSYASHAKSLSPMELAPNTVDEISIHEPSGDGQKNENIDAEDPDEDKERDIPQVLLQKTIEYLSHNNINHDTDEEHKDIEEILDDIDMDHVVGMLEGEEVSPTELEDKIEVAVVDIDEDKAVSHEPPKVEVVDGDDDEDKEESLDAMIVATMSEVLDDMECDTDTIEEKDHHDSDKCAADKPEHEENGAVEDAEENGMKLNHNETDKTTVEKDGKEKEEETDEEYTEQIYAV